jgi:hypothetical protein
MWGEGFGWEWRSHVYEPKNMVFVEAISPEPYPTNLGRIWFAPNHVRAWKRSFYEKIGGHAEMKISDDHDLVARSYLHGTIKHIDKPLYIYRVHGENTWLQVTQEIQDTMWDNYDRYFMLMQEKWARDNDLRLVDLGGAIDSPDGYETYDRHNADIVGDLNKAWKLEDNSVGLLRAHDIVEHLKNPIHTMNEAWRVLSAPALRLRHLMELEGVAAASMGSGVPAGLADSFLQMAGLSREHAGYLERRGAATGAMARALLAEEAAGLRARWAALGGVLERAAADAGERLRGIDARWAEAGGGGWDGLSALQRELALLDRWEEQVRGARLELSF